MNRFVASVCLIGAASSWAWGQDTVAVSSLAFEEDGALRHARFTLGGSTRYDLFYSLTAVPPDYRMDRYALAPGETCHSYHLPSDHRRVTQSRLDLAKEGHRLHYGSVGLVVPGVRIGRPAYAIQVTLAPGSPRFANAPEEVWLVLKGGAVEVAKERYCVGSGLSIREGDEIAFAVGEDSTFANAIAGVTSADPELVLLGRDGRVVRGPSPYLLELRSGSAGQDYKQALLQFIEVLR